MAAVSHNEIVVHDQVETCPYFLDRAARLPMRYPLRRLSPDDFDARLEQGDRRNGIYLYRASCPSCSACEAIRLDVSRFTLSASRRRIERRGKREFTISIRSPKVDAERVQLFNRHREGRGLSQNLESVDEPGYRSFLVDSCCDTIEIDYFRNGALTGVAICDRGRTSLSAVYCYYDLACSSLSPGVFSILTQIRLCREWNLRYLYLGYYIADSPHMSYKGSYLPHERRVGGRWLRFG